MSPNQTIILTALFFALIAIFSIWFYNVAMVETPNHVHAPLLWLLIIGVTVGPFLYYIFQE